MPIEVKKDPRYRVKKSFLKKACLQILKNLGVRQEVSVGIVLVGKRKAQSLNQEYRKQDYVPLVLSFPYRQDMPDSNYLLGEVVICFPLVREKAIRENQTIEKALVELLDHGLKNLIIK